MEDSRIEKLLKEVEFKNPEQYEIMQTIRTMLQSLDSNITEKVMYGGIMFSSTQDFGGVFAYAKHVSMEFTQGCDLADPHGVLEGKGRLRRHIKLYSVDDIKIKHLAEYLQNALQF
jgi:hypothetical protein